MARPVSVVTPVGLFSNASSQVSKVFGKTTTRLDGTLITTSPISSHPPVVLHSAGSGLGSAADGGVQIPGVASSDANCSMPVMSNPVGIVCDAGTTAAAGGKVVGAGHGFGVATDWADALEPIPATTSSSISPAILKFLRICSN